MEIQATQGRSHQGVTDQVSLQVLGRGVSHQLGMQLCGQAVESCVISGSRQDRGPSPGIASWSAPGHIHTSYFQHSPRTWCAATQDPHALCPLELASYFRLLSTVLPQPPLQWPPPAPCLISPPYGAGYVFLDLKHLLGEPPKCHGILSSGPCSGYLPPFLTKVLLITNGQDHAFFQDGPHMSPQDSAAPDLTRLK